MSTHEYTPEEALDRLLKKIQETSPGLADQVRSAIDAGKDVEQEEERGVRRGTRGRRRVYRKTVPLTKEEALQVALDVLSAYFVEQPRFVSSAVRYFALADIAEPERRTRLSSGFGSPIRQIASDTGERKLEIELRPETQISASNEEKQLLVPADDSLVADQSANVDILRQLLRFEPD